MRVSVIILNYNTFALTSDCIRSVIAYTKDIPFEIILVDNASAECDPDRFLEEFPGIGLVKNTVNAGFACGNNMGIKEAGGEFILLLNSDTVLTEDSVSRSVAYLSQQADAGVVGCRMIFPDGKVQYSARRFRSISWELLDLFRFIPYLMPYMKRARRMLGKYFRHDENMECDWVNGAFFLFPRQLLEQLPGKKLDERFFMYAEDQLWCEQIKRTGHRILFYAGTTIVHIQSGSTNPEKQISLRNTMMKHELEIMRLRKGRGVYYFMFWIIYVTKETFRNIIKSFIYTFSGRVLR